MELTNKPLEQRYRGKPVRRMHVMVKPTGALCNLDCTYCYYLSKQELLGRPEQWRISDEVLELYFRQRNNNGKEKEPAMTAYGIKRGKANEDCADVIDIAVTVFGCSTCADMGRRPVFV